MPARPGDAEGYGGEGRSENECDLVIAEKSLARTSV